MLEGNIAGLFGGPAVTIGITERETKQAWEKPGGGTNKILALPPGLLYLSALCICLPQTQLAGAQLPCTQHGTAHYACCLGSSVLGCEGCQGDSKYLPAPRQCFDGLCSALLQRLHCLRWHLGRSDTWGLLEAQNKGTAAQGSIPEHQGKISRA